MHGLLCMHVCEDDFQQVDVVGQPIVSISNILQHKSHYSSYLVYNFPRFLFILNLFLSSVQVFSLKLLIFYNPDVI